MSHHTTDLTQEHVPYQNTEDILERWRNQRYESFVETLKESSLSSTHPVLLYGLLKDDKFGLNLCNNIKKFLNDFKHQQVNGDTFIKVIGNLATTFNTFNEPLYGWEHFLQHACQFDFVSPSEYHVMLFYPTSTNLPPNQIVVDGVPVISDGINPVTIEEESSDPIPVATLEPASVLEYEQIQSTPKKYPPQASTVPSMSSIKTERVSVAARSDIKARALFKTAADSDLKALKETESTTRTQAVEETKRITEVEKTKRSNNELEKSKNDLAMMKLQIELETMKRQQPSAKLISAPGSSRESHPEPSVTPAAGITLTTTTQQASQLDNVGPTKWTTLLSYDETGSTFPRAPSLAKHFAKTSCGGKIVRVGNKKPLMSDTKKPIFCTYRCDCTPLTARENARFRLLQFTKTEGPKTSYVFELQVHDDDNTHSTGKVVALR